MSVIRQNRISKYKNAFTLIEMVIVIAVISILLVIWMSFGWDQVGRLSAKVTTEYITDNFHKVHKKATTSSYNAWKQFEYVLVEFTENTEQFDIKYKYIGEYDLSTEYVYDQEKPDFVISGIYDWNASLYFAQVKILPNQISCSVLDEGDNPISNLILKFDIEVSKHCFSLEQNTCRLKKYDCSLLDD